jgi:hypothetical protein
VIYAEFIHASETAEAALRAFYKAYEVRDQRVFDPRHL